MKILILLLMFFLVGCNKQEESLQQAIVNKEAKPNETSASSLMELGMLGYMISSSSNKDAEKKRSERIIYIKDPKTTYLGFKKISKK